jgi:hypothetical protein
MTAPCVLLYVPSVALPEGGVYVAVPIFTMAPVGMVTPFSNT